jgi:hypothetical protein
VPFPGTRRIKYLEENGAAADIAMTEDEVKALDAAAYVSSIEAPNSDIVGGGAQSSAGPQLMIRSAGSPGRVPTRGEIGERTICDIGADQSFTAMIYLAAAVINSR